MANESGITDPIAERIVWLVREEERTRFHVVLARPKRLGDGEDFRCDYEIRGLYPGTRHAYGVDGVQAIQLTIMRIEAELQAAAVRAGGELSLSAGDANRAD